MEARKERREQLEKDEEIRVENNGNKGSENTTEEKKEINKIDPVAKMVIRDAIITNNHNTTGGGGGGGFGWRSSISRCFLHSPDQFTK
ncbi:hypothetical protein O6P43_002796 [Quillaja saponaria]|uniref:Uncharacterized protein n=1 Tax=Quillaja saponaria TaxID=32244 RepID=A0AAD7QD90_QUISA|nr:hypothetical protein O6P43_002796 [Quillaja saponaria]